MGKTLRDLQLCELEIVRNVLEICHRHNLQIYMIGGTFLGAVRHRGFIPWDDDIDFVMMRADYDKLLLLAEGGAISLPANYEFDTADVSVIKLRRSDTTMLHPRYRRSDDLNQGVWVDVFCLDYAPDDLSSCLSEYEKLRTDIRMYRNNRLGYYAMSPNIHYFVGHLGLKILFAFKSRKQLRENIENRLKKINEKLKKQKEKIEKQKENVKKQSDLIKKQSRTLDEQAHKLAELQQKQNSEKHKMNLLQQKVNPIIQSYIIPHINKEKVDYSIEMFDKFALNQQEKRDKRVIVSLTSYPDRMYDIHYCLYSLLNQTFKPDKIILYLTKEQFPNLEKD